ncbi:MAG: UDP-N-acetylmuramoyl-tripeptide--D-alanyl-D-alanine ligase [Anaerolineales bacterium]|jgi:UDP-N-acetylmuramoyl-tripeptide--D-alanyl-D-alanine ligase
MITLHDLLEALIGSRPLWANRSFTNAVVDSRQAVPGSIFFAFPGEHVDGHDFIDDAFNNGAIVAITQREMSPDYRVVDLRSEGSHEKEGELGSAWIAETQPYFPVCFWVDDTLTALQQIARFWRRKLDPRVVGITGSVGKTTTKELVASVLERRYRTLKNPGNLNNEIGLPLTLLHLGQSDERAVLEMGLYVEGEIALLCDISLPHVGIVTNVGTVHAERAGSQEAIARGKAELVRALPSEPGGVAVLNFDDPWVRQMAEATKARVFFYGLSPKADLWADGVESLGLEGIRFRLHYRGEVLHLRIPLIGRHSVHTALRAAAVGIVEDLTWQDIVDGLRSEKTQLRMVIARADSGALILDDTYNASPQSMLAALNLLDELEGYKVAVLGDMLELGQYEKRSHEMVGIRASEVADEIVTVGGLARVIADAARRAGFSPASITELEDTEEAITYLSKQLHADDVVLVKGSHGLHMDRIVTALESDQ